MAISPINVIRTSFNLQTVSLLDSLRQSTLGLFLEQNRLGSGNRLNAPSEDPVVAAQAIQLTEILERQDQLLTNIQHADSFLAATDAAISEVNSLLIDAKAIASEMVNSTSDQAQRDSMAELVRGIIDQLVTVGNRTFGGTFLFGGQQTTKSPFTQQFGGVEYQGDTGSLTAHVDFQQDPTINLTGAELFGVLAGEVSGYVDLDPALTDKTRLVDLEGAAGVGVTPGQIRISLSGPATTFVVDLSQADTIGGVVSMLNGAAEAAGLTVAPGGDFEASINPAGNGVAIAIGGGTITVADVGEDGTVARDLGIAATAAPGLAGADLNPRVTQMTPIASLFGGTGAALGSILIENGSLSATIDLSTANTVQEVLNKINAAGVEVVAQVNAAGTGIDIVNRMSGAELSVGEAGGTTAELLGIRSLHGQTLLSEMNHGQGVGSITGQADFQIVAKDGSTVDVNIDGATTLQDVLDAINTAATGAGVAISASLATTGNGIRIVDATGGAGPLYVERLNFSTAIDDLGLNKVVNDAGTELVGDNTNGIEPDSVFSALIALHTALVDGGDDAEQAITLAAERLDEAIEYTNRVRGMVGARSKAMNVRLQHTEDAVVATQSLLSQVKDLDYTEAITRFQQAQTALQANLLTGSRLLQLSLLDYL